MSWPSSPAWSRRKSRTRESGGNRAYQLNWYKVNWPPQMNNSSYIHSVDIIEVSVQFVQFVNSQKIPSPWLGWNPWPAPPLEVLTNELRCDSSSFNFVLWHKDLHTATCTMSHGKWQIWFKSLKVWLQGKETAFSLFMNMGLQKKK